MQVCAKPSTNIKSTLDAIEQALDLGESTKVAQGSSAQVLPGSTPILGDGECWTLAGMPAWSKIT